MKTILIILGILVCINFLVITISKAFAGNVSLDSGKLPALSTMVY